MCVYIENSIFYSPVWLLSVTFLFFGPLYESHLPTTSIYFSLSGSLLDLSLVSSVLKFHNDVLQGECIFIHFAEHSTQRALSMGELNVL